MPRTRVIALLAVLLAAVGAATTAGPASAADQKFASVVFSRSAFAPAKGCSPMPGSVSMDQALAWLSSVGVRATASVVVDRTAADTRVCYNGVVQSSAADLRAWREQYGLVVTSHGLTHNNFTSMSADQQRVEACGSLSWFTEQGHTEAWSMFSPASAQITKEAAKVVSECFAYTRVYGKKVNTQGQMLNNYAKTWGLLGGACNDPALACYAMKTTPTQARYDSVPNVVAHVRSVGAGQWVLVQGYTYVTGSSPGLFDCTSADWRAHWTLRPEMWCWNDFQTVITSVADDVLRVTPDEVAAAWGRAAALGHAPSA